MVTVRCLIALAIKNKWDMYQLDVNNAFLYGELEEDVYMTLPQGYFSKSETKVCKLVKSLYGLKQAPRKWNEKLVLTLYEHGFIESQSDHSFFIKNTNDIFVSLLVYVDDIVITGNDPIEISKEILLRTLTRVWDACLPDILYSLQCLSQHMHAPLKSNLRDALKVLRYLKGSPGKGLRYSSNNYSDPLSGKVVGFSDADWAKCLVTKKSISGALLNKGKVEVMVERKKDVANL
ncbi:ribonuclease H-like domain-containing protein [Tanacetum coccineum]